MGMIPEPRSPLDRGEWTTAILMILLVISVPTMGCIGNGGGDGDGKDFSEWTVAMTIDRFNTNGNRPVNVTYLLFEARIGPFQRDRWMVQESNSFKKGNESTFPIRIEARYEDGVNEVEPFPIMGDDNVITGALTIRSGKLSVVLDGEGSLYTVDKTIDIYPHDHELTVKVQGVNGELRLYFNMNEPA
jgi:hypothetical protein